MQAESSGTRFDNTSYPFGLQLLGCNAQLLLWPFTSGCEFVKFRNWPGPSVSLNCGANVNAKHRVLDGLFFCLTWYGMWENAKESKTCWPQCHESNCQTQQCEHHHHISPPWSQDRVLWQSAEQLHSVWSYDITWKGLPNHSCSQMSSSDSDPTTNFKHIPLQIKSTIGVYLIDTSSHRAFPRLQTVLFTNTVVAKTKETLV